MQIPTETKETNLHFSTSTQTSTFPNNEDQTTSSISREGRRDFPVIISAVALAAILFIGIVSTIIIAACIIRSKKSLSKFDDAKLHDNEIGKVSYFFG